MKVFANKKMKQFIIILVTVIMLFNVIAPAPLALQVQANEGGIVDAGGGMIVSILGKFTGALALAFQKLLNGVVNIASEFTAGQETETVDVFVSTIVYNQLPIIDANIFNPDTQNPLLQAGDGAGLSGIVKTWYSITRLMALAASLVILVYVAIKIILSSTGQSKAKYTELLKDWLLSLLLIFSLHYVLAAILFCSDAIVDFFKNIVDSGKNTFSYADLQSEVWGMNGMNALIYSLVWLVFLGATFIFLILYIKRLILICFFVIISPIIVLLNTINKIRGKGSDLLNNWLKQFIANVVMQPIDALMFTVVLSGISFCLALEPKQPLVALALLFGYFPLRSWVLKYFEQEPAQNTVDGARGVYKSAANWANKGVAVAGSVKGALNNMPKKPVYRSADEKAVLAGRTNLKSSNTSLGDVSAGNPQILGKDKDGRILTGERGKGLNWVSPEGVPQHGNDGVVTEASSHITPLGNGDVLASPELSHGNTKKGINWKGGVSKGLSIVGKTASVATAATVGGLNRLGGGSFSSSFKNTYNSVDGLGEGFVKAGKSFTAGDYTKRLVGEDAQAYRAYDDMLRKPEVQAQMARMIETYGEAGDQYFEAYNNATSKSDKAMAAQQFVEQLAIGIDEDYRFEKQTFGDIEARRRAVERTMKLESSGKTRQKFVSNMENLRGKTVVHTSGNGGTTEVHTTGNSGTTEVHTTGNSGTTEVYTTGNAGTIEVHTTGSGNNSVVTETVDNVEETDINRDLQDFIMDPKTEDLAYDLIEAMGEGDPLYEEYNRISDQAGKRDIALQFLFEKAKNNWSQRDLTDIVRGKKHQELQKLFKK